ncbi:hypothetical protein LWI28_007946 [Acer negundo]|uniref:Glutathione S-transferase n=1 Tax=Acer negundo TaxID=4023 RepID=A0AAD5JFE2_ACENE|nr:hypothetical protein LWI28_007946 [Acer negundo]
MEDRVVLLDLWASSYAMRVKIALAEKGIEYECKAENLLDKSPLLLEMNPTNKKIPVLIHNGKPICESLVIVEYIDEVWHDKSPQLPSDPYQKSQAKFWADYVDKKANIRHREKGLVRERRRSGSSKERVDRVFEDNGRRAWRQALLWRRRIGFVDVALVPITSWFYTFETFGNFSIEAECPKFIAWSKRCLEKESVVNSLPHPEKIYGYALELKKKFGSA